MPDKNDKVKENVCGNYYVDSSCIDCDVCRDTAPENFKRSDENNYSFVYKQPETPEEKTLFGNHYKAYVVYKDEYLDPNLVKLIPSKF